MQKNKKINKVTLIRAPTLIPMSLVGGYQGVAPLGLAYVARALEDHSYKVFGIDPLGEKLNQYTSFADGLLINGLTPDEIVAKIPEDSDVVGISCMFSNEWILAKIVCQKIRKKMPTVVIVLGGEHATAEFDYILTQTSEVDFCVLGEGERKIIELLDFIQGRTKLEDASGFAFCENGQVVKASSSIGSYRIKEVNSLGWPAWHLFPIENYLDAGLGWAIRGKRSMPILASRGCPYQCSFCSNSKMWGPLWKPRNVEDLILEMKSYMSKYNIDHFDFYDLTAIIDKKWIMDFCQRVISENLNISWSLPAGTRSEALTEDVIALLKKAGLFKIVYAPESGSKRTLLHIKKKVNIENLLSSVKFASKHQLTSKANMVVAFPGESFKDVFWDFVLIFRLAWAGMNDMSYFCFAPYPGSQFFDELVKQNRIRRDADYDLFLAKNVHNSLLDMRSYSDHIPSWSLPIVTLGGIGFFYSVQFLIRPWRLMQTIVRLSTRKPQTMLEMALETLVNDIIIKRILGQKGPVKT